MRSRVLAGAAVAGAAVAAYASVVERNWFTLRSHEVPVLPAGAGPLRVLHISDVHLTPGRHRLMSWIRTLAALEPDLVVNTGDSVAHERALTPFLESLGPLLEVPGVFVYGSNDLYKPTVKNPARYLWRTSAHDHEHDVPTLPYTELSDSLEAAGWLNANNRRGRLKAGDLDIEIGGVDDAHLNRDRYELIAGPTDPQADLRLGVMHTPEPSVMDHFVADGYDLLMAGHTHGGQICLPVVGSLVSNCGIDRRRASGLHHHPAADTGSGQAWLHVSAGLGTSPAAPARFCCRPEATLLTLVPRIG
ncbi:MAG: metallophosphoesterase [Streptosporangiaceae bacterium]